MNGSDLDTFLVVDDDESLRTLLSLVLESAGFASIGVASSEEAIEILENDAGRLKGVILDLNLKGSRGEDVLDQLRALDGNLVIFVISGCLSEEIEERIGERAIEGILTKPFRTAELVQTIRSAVERQKELIASREGA